MTQDDIIVLWKDANGWDVRGYKTTLEDLERFAKLVAAKKQERIIEVVERLGTWAHITEVVAEIRGEA
jgi:hypothetical protein